MLQHINRLVFFFLSVTTNQVFKNVDIFMFLIHQATADRWSLVSHMVSVRPLQKQNKHKNSNEAPNIRLKHSIWVLEDH